MRKGRFACLVVGFTGAASLMAGVTTGEAPDNQQDPAFSLTVSPARLVFDATTRDVGRVVRVSNGGTEPIHVDVAVGEFDQRPNGRVEFFPRRSDRLDTASWVTVRPNQLDLAPGAERRVRVQPNLPAEPEPGERQIGLTFVTPASRAQDNLSISRGIGVQLLVGVPGRVVRRTTIGPLEAPRFADGGPVGLRLRVGNQGNVHRDFLGRQGLKVTGTGGDAVELGDFTVLRESYREVETAWNDLPLVCICHLRVESDDGRGHPISASTTIVVFPLRLGLGSLLLALGLWLLLRSARRRRRDREARRIEGIEQEAYQRGREGVRLAVEMPGSGP